jgi:solute carrier family 25 phosphate transporter 23/24/25/41
LQKFVQQSDEDKSGDVSLQEFVKYIKEHEKNLKLQFSHMDKNKDGTVDLDELMLAFKELGIQMDRAEAKKLLCR